jgi:endoglucanase
MRHQYRALTPVAHTAVHCGMLAALSLVGCSGSGDNTAILAAAGGTVASGGNPGKGGESGTSNASGGAVGGATGSGGSSSNGGRSAAGGVSATGGTASSTGGAATGGAATGGKAAGGNATGGMIGSGGLTSGGMSSTGGLVSGGTAAGGTTGSGGKSTGGMSNTGGKATGGTAAAGSSSKGGATASGGSSGTGVCVAATAVAQMKLGWNVGNSLDSVDASKSDTTVETAWGNPVITADLIKAVAMAGFGAVRIPVTWIGRIGAGPSYTISATFINRVEQVVKFVLDQNLYAIINIHHDGGYNVTGRWINVVDSSSQVTAANTNAVLSEFKAVWAQIADHFKSYGDHLLFESMNEVMVDYGTPKSEYYDVINALNQAFVDTVRAGAGYNPNRCLVVPGYNTNIDYTVAGFVTPKDNSSGKLILSDHYYDPYDFTGSANTHAWGTGNPGIDSWAQEDWVQSQVGKLKSTYIDKGLPMIWGEYGAVNQSGYENYRRYYIEYVTKAVHDAGIAPFIWDNGSTGSGSDAFGLINRSTYAVLYPTILDAMLRAVTSSYTLGDVAKP